MISVTLIFDITLYDLGIKAYNTKEKIKTSRREKINNTSKIEKTRNRDSFINIVDKTESDDGEKSSRELLSKVDKKIKILDFMKNAQEDDIATEPIKEEVSSDIQIDSFS